MKFRKFVKFRQFRMMDVKELASFLSYSYNNLIDDLLTGLSRLRFEDNFDGYVTTVDISRGVVTEIRHNLGSAPSSFIVLNGIAGVIESQNSSINSIYLTLDNDVYSGSITKQVKLLIQR